MEKFERYELLTALFKGTVTVTFRKIDTNEIRVMPCTLNPDILKAHGVNITIDLSGDNMEHFPVWSLDKNAWRSFRLSTVEGWEVL